MATIVGYFSCSIIYPSTNGTPLPRHLVTYHRTIQEEIESLADGVTVIKGLSHVDLHRRDDGEYWAECVWLKLCELMVLDEVELKIVNIIRRFEVLPKHEFTIQKHILKGRNSRDVFVRRVYPCRNTHWRQFDG